MHILSKVTLSALLLACAIASASACDGCSAGSDKPGGEKKPGKTLGDLGVLKAPAACAAHATAEKNTEKTQATATTTAKKDTADTKDVADAGACSSCASRGKKQTATVETKVLTDSAMIRQRINANLRNQATKKD